MSESIQRLYSICPKVKDCISINGREVAHWLEGHFSFPGELLVYLLKKTLKALTKPQNTLADLNTKYACKKSTSLKIIDTTTF